MSDRRLEPAEGPSRLRGFGSAGRTASGYSSAFIWLIFIALPLLDAMSSRDSVSAKVATAAAAGAFVAMFVELAFTAGRPLSPPRGAAIALMVSTATTLTLAERSGWATLFIFTAASAAVVLHRPIAFAGVALCSVLCAGTLLIDAAPSGELIGFTTPTAGVGMLMLVLADLRASNRQLVAARAELARLAVAEERARFARDLHDLLGHSLSVIALKAELAARMLPDRVPAAATHVAEIETVARGALSEVRETVSGYRQPTLDREIAGARMALAAAGIEAEVERPAVTLASAVEAVLAWTVREGATNVIRHSGARHCSVRVSAGLAGVGVEVVDDGRGTSGNGRDGNGLEGLAERVERLHGRLETSASPGGGFRLAVRVPVPTR